jgi:hypothetical protein
MQAVVEFLTVIFQRECPRYRVAQQTCGLVQGAGGALIASENVWQG